MKDGKDFSNRIGRLSHPKFMTPPNLCLRNLNPRNLCLIALASLLVGLTACTNDNPDQIRKQTAEATEAMRRDTKAVVEGVKEGMHSDKAVDINSASREDLLNLPGMTQHDADRIIAERPFKSAHELVARHVIPESEYDKISDRIIAAH
jgi:DNA uptake protein ComE-like DNA-binding protein